MLYLIGLGLGDEKDISLKGLDAIKTCARVYLENYTSFLGAKKQALEALYEKEVMLADREFVEGAEQLLKEAQEGSVALLVIGDPLCATTHWDILERAREKGIKTQVIHNASIMSAIGSTGLQVYKFGKTTSIPFPKEKFAPQTFYNIVKENKSIGAHTLVLLDLDPKENKFLSVNEGLELLRFIERERKEKVVEPTDWCVGIARLGHSDQKIVAGTVLEVSDVDFGSPPHAIVLPGNLHFVEEDALKEFQKRL